MIEEGTKALEAAGGLIGGRPTVVTVKLAISNVYLVRGRPVAYWSTRATRGTVRGFWGSWPGRASGPGRSR